MRDWRPPLRSVQQRAHLLSATQALAMTVLASALALTGAHLLVQGHRLGALFNIAAFAALGVAVLHCYLVRACAAASRWSLLAVSSLAAALIGGAFAPQRAISGVLTLVALTAMALAIHASRPGLRASITEAIGRDIEARVARQRAALRQ